MSKGWFLGFCEKKQSFQKGKGLPPLGYFGWVHPALITRFYGGSILGHCATKGGGDSSSGGKPRFFKFLTLP